MIAARLARQRDHDIAVEHQGHDLALAEPDLGFVDLIAGGDRDCSC